MIRCILAVIAVLISSLSYSQDVISLRNGKNIECKISKIDENTLYYTFKKGERELSSFVHLDQVRTYQINESSNSNEKSDSSQIISKALQQDTIQNNIVIIDTSEYIKSKNKWVSLITYSRYLGTAANGFSIQYTGFNLKNTSKWSIPVIIGYNFITIKFQPELHTDLQLYEYGIGSIGIQPFYRINDYTFLSLGLNMLIGEEAYSSQFNYEIKEQSFFGLDLSQGIAIIPNTTFNATFGISIYERIISSRVYPFDLGIKVDLGIKF